jgi:hypothetical protein
MAGLHWKRRERTVEWRSLQIWEIVVLDCHCKANMRNWMMMVRGQSQQLKEKD